MQLSQLPPDYGEKLKEVYKLLKEYNQKGTMVTDENFDYLADTHPEADWEEDDPQELITNKKILMDTNWELPIGNKIWTVIGLYLNTDNEWCNWELSMILKPKKRGASGIWSQMDIRLLTYNQ